MVSYSLLCRKPNTPIFQERSLDFMGKLIVKKLCLLLALHKDTVELSRIDILVTLAVKELTGFFLGAAGPAHDLFVVHSGVRIDLTQLHAVFGDDNIKAQIIQGSNMVADPQDHISCVLPVGQLLA